MLFRSIDGWRGYRIPGTAILGASVYDDHSDQTVAKEVRQFRRECLIPNGIKSRGRWGTSSNVFCDKWWICVSPDDFHRAQALAAEWLEQHRFDTQYVHSAC